MAGSPEIYVRGNLHELDTVYAADSGTSVQSILNGNTLGPGDVIYLTAGDHANGLFLFLKDRAFRIEKAKRALGWQPRVDLKEGICQTLAWYRDKNWL